MLRFYSKIIYADSEFVATLYETLFDKKPITELIKEESKGTEANAYVFKGNLLTKQINKYTISPVSMLFELFDKRFSVIQQHLVDTSLTVNTKKLLNDNVYYFSTTISGRNHELNTDDCYFYNGYKNILTSHGYKANHFEQNISIWHGSPVHIGNKDYIIRPYIIINS